MLYTNSTNIKKHTQTRGIFGVFFGFVQRTTRRIYVYVMRTRAKYRVQKMLASNIIYSEIQKKQVANKSSIKNVYNQLFVYCRLPKTYRGFAMVFSLSLLILAILTSQYYSPQFIEAEILVQNFMKNDTLVNAGMKILKYETRSTSVKSSKAEFDGGTYTSNQFESGKSDLNAFAAADDYLTLGHFGTTPPDTSITDWWGDTSVCSADFINQGTFVRTQRNATNGWTELTSAGLTNLSGTYTSRTIDAGESVTWNNMSWTSTRPTYKELPDNRGTETVYSGGDVSGTGNLLLVHLNEASGAIVNTSGVTNNGTYNGALWSQGGRFNTAIGFDGVDDFVDFGQDLSLQIGGTASVGYWMKTTQVGSDVPWDAPGITGCEQAATGNDVFWGYITSTGRIAIQAGNTAGSQSTNPINDNTWHYVVLTRNYVTGAVQVYVDGVFNSTGVSETGIKTQYFNSIGRIYDSGGSHGWYRGLLDDVSYWDHVLTPQEIYDQYRRGANRLVFQVRSCDDAACSGETFVGPDGTAATHYSEEMNHTLGFPSLTLTNVPANRYIQYRVTFETDKTTIGPELMCVTFDHDHHNKYDYRRCFNIDYTAAGAKDQTEYQEYLDIDTASLVSTGKMQSDGDDMRFVDADGNLLPYTIADDMNTASTRVWVKMKNIKANQNNKVCMYYGNPDVVSTQSQNDVFTYSNPETIYHVVANTAEATVTDMASYTSNNAVSVGQYSGTLSQYGTAHYPTSVAPTFTQTTAISTTDPINGEYAANGTDTLIPASWAGTSFVYRMDLYTNEFSFISPYCSADVIVRNSAGTIVTNGTFTIAQGGVNNLTTSNNAQGLGNNTSVMIEVSNGCPILVSHHSTASEASMPLIPAAREWYGVPSGNLEIAAITAGTVVNVYYSDNTTATYNLARGQHVYVAVTGSEGSEKAMRAVSNLPIGVNGNNDTDGAEMQTFLPVDEMGYRYYVPQDMQYFAVATLAGISTKVDLYNNGAQCGVGAPTTTYTVTPTGNYPGKVYFGSTTDGVNIAAGACVIASNPISAYFEYSAQNDEHNILTEKQNRQYMYGVSQSIGTEQIGNWSVDGTNNWIRRMPVTITNASTTALSEYQIRLNMAAETPLLFGKTQTNGGDIRVAGNTGDGTDNIPYALEAFNATTSTGTLWAKVPTIPASGSTTFYIYYSPNINTSAYTPRLWLDAADASTITLSGSNVTQWNDKSVNGNNVSQATAGVRPVVANDGTKRIVQFTNDYLSDSNGLWASGTSYTDTYVFATFKNNTLPENGRLMSEAITGGTYEMATPNATNVTYQANATASGILSGAYGGNTTNYNVMRFEAHNGGNRVIARNGTTLFSNATGVSFTGLASALTVGSGVAGTNFQNMNLAEVMVFNGALTGAQVTQIESYLTQKWISGPTSTLTTTGDYNAIFHTESVKPNYYIVDSLSAVQPMSVISFTDNNQVNDGITTRTVEEGEIVSLPFTVGVDQFDTYKVTGPLQIGFAGNATDAAIPISYAGKEFVYRVDQGTDVFSFYAPFAAASVQIQQSSATGWTTLQTVTVGKKSITTVTQDIVNARAFKIISDQPILGFHQASTNDSKIMYPTALGLEQDSGRYELYGVASGTLQLAAISTANVTLYRSSGTTANITLNAANNFVYTESGVGAQGTAYAYHIVSDAPIGATGYNDGDGTETVTFLSQKEFSKEYVLSNPAQYLSIVAKDPSVICRVYNAAGTEITTDGTGTMNYIPPQTGGVRVEPYPNKIIIGGTDVADGALFAEGYRMQCSEPVYAYYEHHLSATISDETSWLTWPQARKRAQVEPVIQDVDAASEQGLYYPSGKDSGTTGLNPIARATYTFDTSAMMYGEHTYWRDVKWKETINSRSSTGGVNQINMEIAYGNPSPTCASATYGAYVPLTTTTLASSTNSSSPIVSYTTNTKQALIPDINSDHSCVRLRINVRTGDQAFAPKLMDFTVGYYIPTLLEDQLSNPSVAVVGATGSTSERYRVLKAITTDTGLNGSRVDTTFNAVSQSSVFTQANVDLFEVSSQTTNPQFTFPPFPALPPVTATTTSPFDQSHGLAVYFTHKRASGAAQTMDYRFNVDIAGNGGPQITRDFRLSVGGL